MINSIHPEYAFRVQAWAVSGLLALLFMLLELVRRRKLKERYSVLWFVTAATLLVLAFRKEWLDVIADGLGIYNAPTALLLLLIGFLILILVHFSVVVSGLLSRQQTLVQEIALLEDRIAELESNPKSEEVRQP